MWLSKKKEENPKVETPKEEQKPTTYNAVIEMILVNNKTDKEYTIKTENDFGLMWEYFKDRGEYPRYDLLTIQQKTNIDGTTWKAKGRFYDFSIISITHKEFDIKQI